MYELAKKNHNNCKFISNNDTRPVRVTSCVLKLRRRPLVFGYEIVRKQGELTQIIQEDTIILPSFESEWLEMQYLHFKFSRESLNSLSVKIESTVELGENEKLMYNINNEGFKESDFGICIMYKCCKTSLVVAKLEPMSFQANALLLYPELMSKNMFLLGMEQVQDDDYRVNFEILEHPAIRGDFMLFFEDEEGVLVDVEEVIFIVKHEDIS